MSKKIKSIEITFENCDGITVPFECIRYISLRNITENLCASSFSNKFNRTKEIGNLFISFNDKFDLLVCSFTGDSAKDRTLKYKDITQISVIYEDGESEWFFVNWKSDTEDNPLQRTYEEDGFCLEIGEQTMKKSEQDKLDEAVAIVLKHKAQLSEIELKALYFSLYVEQMERQQEEDKL